MPRVQLEVVMLEFEEGGNTIWVHGHDGTILRITCTGLIRVAVGEEGCASHTDVLVQGDIAFCLPDPAEEEIDYVH